VVVLYDVRVVKTPKKKRKENQEGGEVDDDTMADG